MTGQGLLKILILEDDPLFRETLELELHEHGYKCFTASNLDETDKLIDQEIFDRALFDLRIGLQNSLNAIASLRRKSPLARIIVFSGYGSIASAVEATKRGADDFLCKPLSTHQIVAALEGQSLPHDDNIQTLAHHERNYIDYVLKQCHGNISQTAKLLGLHRQSLQRKLRKYLPRKS